MLFPLIKELRDPNERRLNKIFTRAHMVESVLYFVLGLCGYLLLCEHVHEHIPIEAMVMASIKTTIMTIGKLGMSFALFFVIPMNFFAARGVFMEAFQLQKSQRNFILVTLGMVIVSTTMAIVFQSVNAYFGLLGGTAGTFMAGGIPVLCYYKFQEERGWKEVGLIVVYACFMALTVTGAVLSVVDPS